AGSLLMYEAAYLLAVLVPPLAWVRRDQRQRLPVWAYAWAGTLALLAARLLLFLWQRGSSSYQLQQSAGVLHDPGLLLAGLGLQLQAGLSYFQRTGAALPHWKSAAGVLPLALPLVSRAVGRTTVAGAFRRRHYLPALGVSALAMLLGVLPFLH